MVHKIHTILQIDFENDVNIGMANFGENKIFQRISTFAKCLHEEKNDHKMVMLCLVRFVEVINKNLQIYKITKCNKKG